MAKRIILIILLIGFSSYLFAQQEPIGLPNDPRIKMLTYQENQVYHIKGHYFYTTTIVFEEGEYLNKNPIIGNPIPWQVIPSGNIVVLKPQLKHADANLTLITNRRTYDFTLSARDSRNITNPDLTFGIRFSYPDTLNRKAMQEHFAQVRELEYRKEREQHNAQKTKRTLNFDYAYSGSDSIKPNLVYDDGQFVYLRFDRNSPQPAIFSVDKARNESPANYRIEKDLMVVEQLNNRFTVRHGNDFGTIILKVPNSDPTDKTTQKKKIITATTNEGQCSEHWFRKLMGTQCGEYADW